MKDFRFAIVRSCVILMLLTIAPSVWASPSNFRYQFPPQNSQGIPAATVIILRPGPKLSPQSIQEKSVTAAGEQSGVHSGRIALSSDNMTITFLPTVPFTPGETVTVRAGSDWETLDFGPVGETEFRFTISTPAVIPVDKDTTNSEGSAGSIVDDAPDFLPSSPVEASSFLNTEDTLPKGFPSMKVTVNTGTAPGKLFLANFMNSALPTATNGHLMILDNDARPLWRKAMNPWAFDFKIQPTGLISYYDASRRKFYGMDSTMTVVDSFACGAGYNTNMHDFKLLPNGHALMISYDTIFHVDLSKYEPNGNKDAIVFDVVLQELDEKKIPIWIWRGVDHFNFVDAVHENFLAKSLDYVHANSIDQDFDGNILLSCRHLDEVCKISRDSGGLMWRLGGEHNQFTFIDDSIGFSHQHSAERLANGNILLYDNGNFHKPAFSRAIEYKLDEVAMTATNVWEFRHQPSISSGAMGNVQRLPNGNTLIGWGLSYNPAVSEVRPDGTTAFEMTMASPNVSYRAFRFPWRESANASVRENQPTQFSLEQNFPNPFNPSTQIELFVPKVSQISLKVYDELGRVMAIVSEGTVSAGRHTYTFSGVGLTSGVYHLVMRSGETRIVRRMVLSK